MCLSELNLLKSWYTLPVLVQKIKDRSNKSIKNIYQPNAEEIHFLTVSVDSVITRFEVTRILNNEVAKCFREHTENH